MSQKTYKTGQFVKFVEGHQLVGTVAVIETVHDDKSMKVRILKNQEWAGRVYQTFPEAVEEFVIPATEIHETSGETPPPPEWPDEPTASETARANWPLIASITAVAILAVFAIYRQATGNVPVPPSAVRIPDPSAQTSTGAAQLFVELQTSELNRLNAEDVADMAAVKEARERMESRKSKKEEILRTLTPYR